MKPFLVGVVSLWLASPVPAQEPDADAPVLALRVVAKRTEYILPAADKDVKRRAHATPVCLVFELTNRSKQTLTVVGAPEPKMVIRDARGTAVPVRELNRFFVPPEKSWMLAPRATVRLLIKELAYLEGPANKGISIPGPGRYSMEASFMVAVTPAPVGVPLLDRPPRGKAAMKWGRVTLQTPPLDLDFKEGDAAAFWVKALTDKDADVRLAALHASQRDKGIRSKAISGLAWSLGDSEAEIRISACLALGTAGKEARGHLDALLSRCADKNAKVRGEAARAAVAIAPEQPKTLQAVATLIADSELEVRRISSSVFRSCLYHSRKVEPPLRAKLLKALRNETDLITRLNLINALAYVPELDVLQAMLGLMQGAGSPEAEAALACIGQVCRELPREGDRTLARDAVKVMIAALKDPQNRNVAAYWLQYMMPEATEAVPTLIWALDDPDSFPRSPNTIRGDICRTLGAIGPDAEMAAPALVKRMLTDENWQVRSFAAEALAKLGKSGVKHIPDLVASLKDGMDQVRSSATESLGRLGPAGEAAIPHLLHLLQTEPSEKARVSAAAALCQIGMRNRKSAIPQLIDMLRDRTPPVAISAAQALGQIGPDANEALPSLRRMLVDGRFTDRGAIEAAIKAIEGR